MPHQSKRRVQSDEEDEEPPIPSTKRPRVLTKKKQEMVDRSTTSKDAQIQKLQKQLLRAKKKAARVPAEDPDGESERNDDVESEDSQSEPEEEPTMRFSSAIHSMGVLSPLTPAIKKILRQETVGSPAILTTPRAPKRLERAELDTADSEILDNSNLPRTPMQKARHAPSSRSMSSSLRAGSAGTPSQAALTTSPAQTTASPTPSRAVSMQPQTSSGNELGTVRGTSRTPSQDWTQILAVPMVLTAEFVDGIVSTGRPKVGDYKDPVPGLILKAIHEYECRIWTRDAFPSNDLLAQWVGEVWDRAGEEISKEYALTRRISVLITGRGSHARGTAKDRIRPLIQSAYGFEISDKPSLIAKNREKYDTLMNDAAFHYSDPIERTGFASHPIIKRAIKETWFQKKNSPGIVFTEYFNPITVANLAIIFTTVEFCIQEWSTGTYIQGTLNEDRDKSRYHVFVCRLTEWDSLKPQVTLKIRRKLHDRSRRLTGVTSNSSTQASLNTATKAAALAELEGRTGETDSELEEHEATVDPE